MGFYPKFPTRPACSCPVIESSKEVRKDGYTSVKCVDLRSEKLPDAKLMSVDSQMKAGVNVRQINTKILDPQGLDNLVENFELNSNKSKED